MVIITMATRRNPTSLKNALFDTTDGHSTQIEPTTTVEINTLPPTKAPIPTKTSALPATDAKEENTSGAPLPNTKNVTPAKAYDKFNLLQILPSAGEK